MKKFIQVALLAMFTSLPLAAYAGGKFVEEDELAPLAIIKPVKVAPAKIKKAPIKRAVTKKLPLKRAVAKKTPAKSKKPVAKKAAPKKDTKVAYDSKDQYGRGLHSTPIPLLPAAAPAVETFAKPESVVGVTVDRRVRILANEEENIEDEMEIPEDPTRQQKILDAIRSVQVVPVDSAAREVVITNLKDGVAPTAKIEIPAEAPAKVLIPGNELTLDQAKKVIYDLRFSTVGTKDRSEQTVKVEGLLFESCLKAPGADFAILPFQQAGSDSKTITKVGYRIYDKDQVVSKCVAEKEKAHAVCDRGEGNQCINIGDDHYHELASLKGAGSPTSLVEIGLFSKVPNTIRDFKFESTIAPYKTVAFEMRQRREELLSSTRESVNSQKQIVAACRGNENELKFAEKACSMLRALRRDIVGVDASLASDIDDSLSACSAELPDARLKLLLARIQKANKTEELQSLADALASLARRYPAMSGQIFKELRGVAIRIKNAPVLQMPSMPGMPNNTSQQQFAQQEERLQVAKSIIEKAMNLPGLPADLAQLAENDLRELSLASCQGMATAYGAYAPQVQFCLQDAAMMAQQAYQESCASMETRGACLNAMQLQQTVGNIYKAGMETSMKQQQDFQKQQQAMLSGQGASNSPWLASSQQGGAPMVAPTQGFNGNVGTAFNPAFNPQTQMPGLTNLGMQSFSLNTQSSGNRSFGPLTPM